MLRGNISPNEIIAVIADEAPLPDHSKYEENVKNDINNAFGRLAVHGICHVDSKGHDILQIVDLLLGAITYDLKIKHKLAGKSNSIQVKVKIDLLNYIKTKIGAQGFERGFRNDIYNIKLF
jgi:hypothetical protein